MSEKEEGGKPLPSKRKKKYEAPTLVEEETFERDVLQNTRKSVGGGCGPPLDPS